MKIYPLTLVYLSCPERQVAILSCLVLVEFIELAVRHKDAVRDKFPMCNLSIDNCRELLLDIKFLSPEWLAFAPYHTCMNSCCSHCTYSQLWAIMLITKFAMYVVPVIKRLLQDVFCNKTVYGDFSKENNLSSQKFISKFCVGR